MKIYNWGFFFEDGNKLSIEFPFGPEHPDNIIYDLDSEWMDKALEVYPDLIIKMNDLNLPFALVIVNAPEEKDDDYAWHL